MGNEGKLFADPSNITAQFSETTQFFHARGQYIGTFQDRLHLYITYNGNTVTFLKYRSPNPADLGINDPGNLSGWPAAESSVSVELPITLNYILKAFVDTSKKLMYFFTNTRIEQGSVLYQHTGVHARRRLAEDLQHLQPEFQLLFNVGGHAGRLGRREKDSGFRQLG